MRRLFAACLALDRMLHTVEVVAAAEPVPAAKQGGCKVSARRLFAAVRVNAGGRAVALAACLGVLSFGAMSAGDAKPVTVADLLAGSPAADWRTPNPDDTLYLDLPRGHVVIELAAHVAPQHVANVKRLVRAHYFDGLAIIRVQDNYVVQWDDADHRRPIPVGVRPSVELIADAHAASRFVPLPDRDLYAAEVGFLDGFPAARDPTTHTAWLAHCYGMVGAGRDDPPESDGTEMYAVIGHAPRQLDRNVALFGRVLMGMELLSSLPRGSGEMGFYVASEPPVPILSMRLASDVPAAERTPIEVLRTESATFRAVLAQRRDRHESWFKVQSGAHRSLQRAPARPNDRRLLDTIPRRRLLPE